MVMAFEINITNRLSKVAMPLISTGCGTPVMAPPSEARQAWR